MVFEVFRSRQKSMIAFLAIAAMFAFIVLPIMTSYTGDARRDATEIRAWGSPISTAEYMQFVHDRGKLNEFLRRASVLAGFEQPVYRFPNESREQVLADLAFEKKAQQLGISVSVEDAKKWLKAVTQDRLSEKEIADIISGAANYKLASAMGGEVEPLKLPERALFQTLMRELAIQRAQDAAIPPAVAMLDTPVLIWMSSSPKLTEVKLDLIDVPVSQFIDESSQPTDAEIQELYERLKYEAPDPATGQPGFLQPRRVNVQYLEGKLADLFGEVAVTDEDIAKYYEEHKSEFVEIPEPAVVPPPPPTTEEAPAPEPPEAESAFEKEATEPADQKSTESDAPAETAPPATPETPASETPTPEPENPTPEPADGTPQQAGLPTETRSKLRIVSAAAKLAIGASAALQSAEPTDADEKAPDAESKDAPTEPQVPDEPVAPTDPPAVPAVEPVAPASEPEANAPAANDESTAEPPKAPSSPRVKSLDEVREEIREILQRQKAGPIVLDRMQKIVDTVMSPYAYDKFRPARAQFERTHPESEWSNFQPPAPPELESIASENHFELRTTGPLTKSQFESMEGLNQATRVDRTATTPEGFANLVFGGPIGEDLYIPRIVFNDKIGAYYAFWKTEDLAPSPQPLEAIRDEVVQTWRRENALKKAKEFAEQLAVKATEKGGDLAAALPEGSDLKVETTDRFPQTRTIPMPQQGFDFPIPVEIPQIPGADERFLDEVFQLKQGDISVIPDTSNENFYVVKVAERFEPEFGEFAREYRNDQLMRQRFAMQARNELRGRMFMQALEEAGLEPPLFQPPPPESDEAAEAAP